MLSELKRKNGKVVPLELIEVGKNGCIQKKWVLLELIYLKKGGFFPRGGTLIFCGYIGEAPASTPNPQKLLRFADHPKKIPVLSGIPKKILELLAYPKKLRIHLFYAY